MLVRLHTDVKDPEARLEAIAIDSQATLSSQREHNAKVLQNIPRVLGPMLLSLGGKGHLDVRAHKIGCRPLQT